MARNLQLSALGVNTILDGGTPGFAALFNSGYLRGYTGPQPATADTAITTQTLLFELRFDATAFGAAAAGIITAAAIVSDPSAPATGTAAWFRALKSNGTSGIIDGTVAATDADLPLDPAIIIGQTVAVQGMTIQMPEHA